MRGAFIGIDLACSSSCVRWVVGSRLRFLTFTFLETNLDSCMLLLGLNFCAATSSNTLNAKITLISTLLLVLSAIHVHVQLLAITSAGTYVFSVYMAAWCH